MNHPVHPCCDRRQGFSLVELMVALAAGLVVSLAVVAFLMASFKSNSDYTLSTRLTQELRNTLDLITRDLRRAGYDDNSMAYLATNAGSPLTHMRLCGANGTTCPGTPNTCVVYAYDRVSGAPGTVDLNLGERRGVRFKNNATLADGSVVGVIEYAVSSVGVAPTCNGASPNYATFPIVCNAASGWCPLSDPSKLNMTSFTLTDVGAATGGVQLRNINVVLQGQPRGATDYVRGVRSSVRIRSDCFDANLTNCSAYP